MAIRVPKDRRLACSALLLSATTTLLCRTTGLRPSLEVALNLLWSGLVLATFIMWRCRRNSGSRSPRLQLLSLVFVFALLFPVISPSDDLAQPLEDDACTTQLVIRGLNAEKHLVPAAALAAPSVTSWSLPPRAQSGRKVLTLSPAKPLPSAIRHATGNHSPPLA